MQDYYRIHIILNMNSRLLSEQKFEHNNKQEKKISLRESTCDQIDKTEMTAIHEKFIGHSFQLNGYHISPKTDRKNTSR